MKKLYNFLAVFMVMVLSLGTLSAQTILFQEDFSGVTGNGTQQCEASGTAFTATTIATALPGWDSYKAYPANGKVKLGTSSVNGWIETPAIDMTGAGSIRVEFDARSWNSGSDATYMTVYVGSTAYTVEGLPNTGATSNVECDLAHFVVRAAGGSNVSIRFEGAPRCFIDNVVVYESTEAAVAVEGNATFSVLAVNETANTQLVARGYNLTAGQNSTISLSGDSHFQTTAPATVANNDLMSEDGVSIPVSFVADAPGLYTATISISNSDLSNPITVNLSANVVAMIDVPTIAELRAIVDLSNCNDTLTAAGIYRYTGHAYVTQAFTNNKTKWMQDQTGAIQIYDNSLLLDDVHVGHEITNVVGHVMNYYGYAEIKPISSISPETDIEYFPTYVPAPQVITLEQLQDRDYMTEIQGQLVKLENVTFNETGTFEAPYRYTVTQDGATDSAIYFTSTYDTQVGTDIPTGAVDVVGVNMITAAYSAGFSTPRVECRYYVLPRDSHAIGIAENENSTVSVYPNPFEDNITVEATEPVTTAVIYNVQGQVVASKAVRMGANVVELNNLTSGIYMLRLYNDNQLVGTAKVVRK